MTNDAPPSTVTSPSSVRRWAGEPLLHFLAIGLLLCLATAAWQRLTDAHRIVITPQRVAQLANRHALQFGATPDARTLEALIERETRDEILYREGLAIGVAKDDEMVRRRVIQKMEFVTQDLHPPAEPSASQLEAFYAAHTGRYAAPERVSFTHVFFAEDARGSANARERAIRELHVLRPAVVRAPERGDPFPDAYDYTNYDAEQVVRLFGRTPIATALLEAPPGRWIGPVQSSYGWHLVRIQARSTAQPVGLASVRARVRTDFLLDAQAQSNQRAFEQLARRYTIVRTRAAE
jgi:peptidyl-prolyl cis-trans isomerase C